MGGGGVLVVEGEGAEAVLPFRIGLLCIVVYPIYVFISFPGLCSEIDGAAHGVMDAAHIQHQLPVNEDPAVVVPLEFEGHVLHFFGLPGGRHVDLAALGHGKGQVNALAEHVVELGQLRLFIRSSVIGCSLMKWQERSRVIPGVCIERGRFLHIIGPVGVLFEGAAFRAAVVFPVSVLVLSEGEADVAVDAAQRDVQGVVTPQEGLAEIGGRVAVLGQGVVGQGRIHQIAAGTVVSRPHVGVVRVVVQLAVHFVQGVELFEAVRQVVIPGPVSWRICISHVTSAEIQRCTGGRTHRGAVKFFEIFADANVQQHALFVVVITARSLRNGLPRLLPQGIVVIEGGGGIVGIVLGGEFPRRHLGAAVPQAVDFQRRAPLAVQVVVVAGLGIVVGGMAYIRSIQIPVGKETGVGIGRVDLQRRREPIIVIILCFRIGIQRAAEHHMGVLFRDARNAPHLVGDFVFSDGTFLQFHFQPAATPFSRNNELVDDLVFGPFEFPGLLPGHPLIGVALLLPKHHLHLAEGGDGVVEVDAAGFFGRGGLVGGPDFARVLPQIVHLDGVAPAAGHKSEQEGAGAGVGAVGDLIRQGKDGVFGEALLVGGHLEIENAGGLRLGVDQKALVGDVGVAPVFGGHSVPAQVKVFDGLLLGVAVVLGVKIEQLVLDALVGVGGVGVPVGILHTGVVVVGVHPAGFVAEPAGRTPGVGDVPRALLPAEVVVPVEFILLAALAGQVKGDLLVEKAAGIIWIVWIVDFLREGGHIDAVAHLVHGAGQVLVFPGRVRGGGVGELDELGLHRHDGVGVIPFQAVQVHEIDLFVGLGFAGGAGVETGGQQGDGVDGEVIVGGGAPVAGVVAAVIVEGRQAAGAEGDGLGAGRGGAVQLPDAAQRVGGLRPAGRVEGHLFAAARRHRDGVQPALTAGHGQGFPVAGGGGEHRFHPGQGVGFPLQVHKGQHLAGQHVFGRVGGGGGGRRFGGDRRPGGGRGPGGGRRPGGGWGRGGGRRCGGSRRPGGGRGPGGGRRCGGGQVGGCGGGRFGHDEITLGRYRGCGFGQRRCFGVRAGQGRARRRRQENTKTEQRRDASFGPKQRFHPEIFPALTSLRPEQRKDAKKL